MEKWKAKRDFADADDLFKRKKYNDALAILNRLNREFPDNFRVMMPRALCLAEMGRYHEAATVCEQILSKDEYPRARKLLVRLQPYMKGAAAIPVAQPPGVFDRLETETPPAPGTLDFGDERPLYAPSMETGGGWVKPLMITLVVVALAAMIGGGAFYYVIHQELGQKEVAKSEPVEPPPAPVTPPAEIWTPDYSQYNKYADPAALAQVQEQLQAQQTPPPAPFPGATPDQMPNGLVDTQTGEVDSEAGAPSAEEVDISDEGVLALGVGTLAILFVVGCVLEFVVLFCTLLLLNKMPRPTLGENLLLIGGVAVAAILVSQIPYVGKFAALFMIITVFQLTFVDVLVMILVNVVVMVGAIFVFVAFVGAGVWGLLW